MLIPPPTFKHKQKQKKEHNHPSTLLISGCFTGSKVTIFDNIPRPVTILGMSPNVRDGQHVINLYILPNSSQVITAKGQDA